MKPSLKMRARRFWEDHKGDIIAAVLLVGGAVCTILAARNACKNLEPEEAETNYIPEKNSEPEEKKPNPRFECGAEIVMDDLDGLNDFPEIMLNDIPLDNMEAFGEEMRRRIEEAGLEEKGWIKDASKAKLSAWITVQSDTDEEAEEKPEEPTKEEEKANDETAA